MSVRKLFGKKIVKIFTIGLFTMLMLTNIKFALLNDNEIASGDISLFGIEIQLFDATYGETGTYDGPLVYTHDYYCCDDSDGSLCNGPNYCPS